MADEFDFEAEHEAWRETIDDDGVILTVDDSDNQRLWFRVGPMWVKEDLHNEQMLWIEYQEVGSRSTMYGPVLISREGWQEINRWVEERFEDVHQRSDS